MGTFKDSFCWIVLLGFRNFSHCMELVHRESITMSLFILAGPELKATIEFDGPLPEDSETKIDSGLAMQNAIKRLDQGYHDKEKYLHHEEMVDFEHLNLGEEEDEEEEDEEYRENESLEERRERRARQRKKALEARQRREQHKIKQRQRVRQEGEPFQKTIKVEHAGWYRYCVKGSYYQVTAEIELRKESDMGGLNDDGHVLTSRQKAMEAEERLMDKDTAASEGIKDEDFHNTREKLKTLRRLLADIQSKQSQERHRLIIHAATNEHSHSRMVLSSLLETILFMAVTGFQVYTIRKWFRGAPVLGR